VNVAEAWMDLRAATPVAGLEPFLVQGHTDTPTHHPNTPRHHPGTSRPQKPQHPHHQPATKAHREHPSRHQQQQKKEDKKPERGRGAHKSAPETERTLPTGGDVRERIPSLGALPITYRRH